MIRFCMTDTGITVRGRSVIGDFPMKPETIWTLSMDIRKTVPLQCLCLQTKKQKTNITAIILPQAEATR